MSKGQHQFKGHIDSITSAGYVEGWAFDDNRPMQALPVSVHAQGKPIASGLAHRFRNDLMEAACGTGWCGFRLRLNCDGADLDGLALDLVETTSGQVVHQNPFTAALKDLALPADSIESICAHDPTILEGVWQLRGCEREMMAFIRSKGIEQFLRLAYVYVLGRPADDGGLKNYGHSLRQSRLSPVGILESLADSDEFRSQNRQMTAPNALGFPFIQ